MRKVIIESPYAARNPDGSVDPVGMMRNYRYLMMAMRSCLQQGEAPFASHALYTQPGVLDDMNPAERELGIDAGFAWGEAADATVVFIDLGFSAGMYQGILAAMLDGRPVEYRSLPDWETAQNPTEQGEDYEQEEYLEECRCQEAILKVCREAIEEACDEEDREEACQGEGRSEGEAGRN